MTNPIRHAEPSDDVLPIPGLIHADPNARPACAVCAGPINWMFEGSDTCRTCRAKAEREAA